MNVKHSNSNTLYLQNQDEIIVRHKQPSLEESLEGIDFEMSTNKQNPVKITMLDSSKHGDSPNVPGDKPDSIIAAISLMTKQLVSSISTLNSSMDKSFDEMKETLLGAHAGESLDLGQIEACNKVK